MEYELMSPPFEMNNFSDMNKVEAKQHYDWYLSQIPKRMEQLKYFVEGDMSFSFNYTRESLIALWGWYLDNVVVENKIESELDSEIAHSTQMTIKHIRNNKISTKWLSVAVDIGIYLSEVIIKNNEVLEWGIQYKPKSLLSVNRPVVIGFNHKMTMEPSNLLLVLTRKILKGQYNPEALVNLYDNWIMQI